MTGYKSVVPAAPAASPAATTAPVVAVPPANPVALSSPGSPPVTQNISSDEIERSEVEKIAAELKHEFDEKAETKPANRTEDTFELKEGKDDTISLIAKGNFQVKDSEK